MSATVMEASTAETLDRLEEFAATVVRAIELKNQLGWNPTATDRGLDNIYDGPYRRPLDGAVWELVFTLGLGSESSVSLETQIVEYAAELRKLVALARAEVAS